MRSSIFLAVIAILYTSSVRAEAPLPWRSEEEKPPSPEAKFFPIDPAAHRLPVTRSPYGVRSSQPVSPEKKQSPSQGPMSEVQAKQLLSIYSN